MSRVHPRPGPGGIADGYVLVVDGDMQRAALCVFEAARAFDGPARVCGSKDEAIEMLRRHGLPQVLVVDLSLPNRGGFEVVDAVRRTDEGPVRVIGWAPTRDVRDFALRKENPTDMKVLRAAARPSVLRGAMKWACAGAEAAEPPDADDATGAEEQMQMLADSAERLSGCSGIAVYLQDGSPADDRPLRALVRWNSEAPMPASPGLLPRVADIIIKTGDVIRWLDLEEHGTGGADLHDVRGVVGVPLLDDQGRSRGALLLFDAEPLRLTPHDIDALERLGKSRRQQPPVTESAPAAGPVDRRAERGCPPTTPRPPLPDRAAAEFAIARELARARREQIPLGIILLQVVIDEEASTVWSGPDPLSRAADAFSSAGRGSDLAIRWDDQRLLVVMADSTETHARLVAERLRTAMTTSDGPIRVLAGIAELAPGDTIDAAVERAAERLRAGATGGDDRTA